MLRSPFRPRGCIHLDLKAQQQEQEQEQQQQQEQEQEQEQQQQQQQQQKEKEAAKAQEAEQHQSNLACNSKTTRCTILSNVEARNSGRKFDRSRGASRSKSPCEGKIPPTHFEEWKTPALESKQQTQQSSSTSNSSSSSSSSSSSASTSRNNSKTHKAHTQANDLTAAHALRDRSYSASSQT